MQWLFYQWECCFGVTVWWSHWEVGCKRTKICLIGIEKTAVSYSFLLSSVVVGCIIIKVGFYDLSLTPNYLTNPPYFPKKIFFFISSIFNLIKLIKWTFNKTNPPTSTNKNHHSSSPHNSKTLSVSTTSTKI